MTGVVLDIRTGAEHIGNRVRRVFEADAALAALSLHVVCVWRANDVLPPSTSKPRVLVGMCTRSEYVRHIGAGFHDALPCTGDLSARFHAQLRPGFGLAKCKTPGLLSDRMGEMIDLLVAANGAVVTKKTIYRVVFGLEHFGRTRRAAMMASRIRKVLPEEDRHRLVAAPGGLRFCPPSESLVLFSNALE